MGCGNCGTGADGKPGGCKGNGGCSTGGCNRMNVFDWLSALPLHDSAKPYPVIEVTFNKGSRKDFFRNNTNNILEKGEWIAVEGISGFDLGQVSLTGELVKLQLKKYNVADVATLKRVTRLATDEDFQLYNKHKEREPEIMVRARAMAKSYNLDMKICEVEMQADGKKATFFYTADSRVDFRELIKAYASEFKVKVEMRQIGARQESGKVGGIGSCGRELCCSTWLTDFKSVNTTAARYQNLSINQTKLSGQCGRLKCCLNYELDTYMDALRIFPDHAETLQTVKGNATLQKRDIFKSLMWYSYSDSSKQYPLSIVRVKEILAQNKQGIKADELQPVELETASNKAGLKVVDMGFVNDVGQISLKALEKGNKKKKGKGNSNRPQQAAGSGGDRQQRPQRDRPQGGGQQRERGQGNQQEGQPKEQRPQQQRPQQQARPQRQQRPQQQAEGGQEGQQPKQQQRPQRQQGEGGQQEGQNRQQRPQRDRPQGGGNQQQRPQGNNQNRNRDRGRDRDAKPQTPSTES